VTPQQLAARQGQVRCGHCNTLFNGLEMLAMAGQAASAQSGTSAPAQATPSLAPAEPLRLQERQRENIGSAIDESDAPILYRPDFKPAADVNLKLWISGSALFLALLLLQGTIYCRHSLARNAPSMKPFLTTFCEVTGCEIALLRDADSITIESSDLKQFPDRPKEILLTAALRNRAKFEQAFPSLELTLTDGADQAVAKRVFHPADYVEDKTTVSRGIASLQEVNVRLRLELIDLAAVGYRVFIFYP
jgi:Protein of unknown function (DUF3426)